VFAQVPATARILMAGDGVPCAYACICAGTSALVRYRSTPILINCLILSACRSTVLGETLPGGS